jgi:hypothetical protein
MGLEASITIGNHDQTYQGKLNIIERSRFEPYCQSSLIWNVLQLLHSRFVTGVADQRLKLGAAVPSCARDVIVALRQ